MIVYTGHEFKRVIIELASIHWLNSDKFLLLTTENVDMVELLEDDWTQEDFNRLLKPLIGYSFQIIQEGKHHNDSQLVDYNFIFKSPEGFLTHVHSRMSLMCGHSFDVDIEIN